MQDIDFHCMNKNTEVLFKTSYFMFCRKKETKVVQFWNNTMVHKNDNLFHYISSTYPLHWQSCVLEDRIVHEVNPIWEDLFTSRFKI